LVLWNGSCIQFTCESVKTQSLMFVCDS
jgi:hypothetical protein